MATHRYSTNIAFTPQGTMVTGGRSGVPIEHDWWAVRYALMHHDPAYLSFVDHFTGDLLADEWAANLATGATAAVNAQAGGVVRLSTDDTDDDHATLALGLHWTVSNGVNIFEARLKSVSATTLRAVEVGVSDALSETNGLAFSSHDATPVDVADNAVVFGWNTDETTTQWSLLSVKAGTPAQAFATTGALSTSYVTLRIVIEADGTAWFYINDTLAERRENAIATTAVVTPWITLKSLSGAIKSIDVDYVRMVGAL